MRCSLCLSSAHSRLRCLSSPQLFRVFGNVGAGSRRFCWYCGCLCLWHITYWTRMGRNVVLPKTPEWFSHDLDGHLLTDGKWIYIWYGENRLISIETSTAMTLALRAAMPPVRLEFVYDSLSCRCVKRLDLTQPGRSCPRPTRRSCCSSWRRGRSRPRSPRVRRGRRVRRTGSR